MVGPLMQDTRSTLRHSTVKLDGLDQADLRYLNEQSAMRMMSRSYLLALLIKIVCRDQLVMALIDDADKLAQSNERKQQIKMRKRSATERFETEQKYLRNY